MDILETLNKKLEDTLDLICERFNQNNMPEYNKPYKFDDCVVFFWSCGGILVWKRWCIEFSEDDGYWFETRTESKVICHSWLKDKARCYEAVDKYTREHGTPYYFSGTNTICGYEI